MFVTGGGGDSHMKLRCLCFIFDQVGPDFPFHFSLKIPLAQTVMF